VRVVGATVLGVFALLGSVGGASAASGRATAPLPCTATFQRLAGARLGLSLSCSTAGVLIVLVDFPHTTRIKAGTAFPAANCRASTPSVWYCLFPGGIPVDTTINGKVRFATALPRAPQHARLTFYANVPQTVGSYDRGPGTILVGPAVSGTFTY